MALVHDMQVPSSIPERTVDRPRTVCAGGPWWPAGRRVCPCRGYRNLTRWFLASGEGPLHRAFGTKPPLAKYGREQRISAKTVVHARAAAQQATGSFFDSATPPVWIILVLNVASFLSAITAAYAAIRVAPQTSLKVADAQATVAREAIAVAATSASAAEMSASAANRSSDNQGIHAVARLRQDWINELRGRIAEAHALLSNWRVPTSDETGNAAEQDAVRRIRANEVVARIELLLNVTEAPSQRLLGAIQALQAAGGQTDEQRRLGPSVIEAGQEVLKEEWDRVREELQG